MFLEQESTVVVSRRVIDKLEAAGLNASTPGSHIRTLLDIFLEERVEILRDIRFVASAAFLSLARGAYLDMLGRDLFGLVRTLPNPASATEIDGNILVTSSAGPLANFLPVDSGGYYIPVGIRILDITGEITYTTNKKIYVENAATQAFISAQADQSGPSYNVPAGALVSIDLNGVNVSNLSSIANGAPQEDDDNFRFRISNAHLGAQGRNETAIRIAALSIPGVSNVVINNAAFGPGTIGVLVIPAANSVSVSTMEAVRAAISRVAAREVSVIVDSPVYLSFSVEYAFSGINLSEPEKNSVKNQAISNFSNLLSGASDGTTIDPNSIVSNIVAGFPGLQGRATKLCVNGIPQLTKKYRLQGDEIGIFDITESEPVRAIF